jgi:hypothetical protein
LERGAEEKDHQEGQEKEVKLEHRKLRSRAHREIYFNPNTSCMS